MKDIGDQVVVTTTLEVAGTPVDPVDVVITVTAPDGTETTPTPTNPSPGVYQAIVPATQAGRWRWTWSTTDPTGVAHGHFDVASNPPRPEPLASTADVEARIGPLTEAQTARVGALLADASALVRAFTRQTFDHVTADSVVIRPVGAVLRLPQRPVLAVASVVAVGYNGLPDITLAGWGWDGLDKIDVGGLGQVVLNLPEWWYEGTGANTYRVTYDHGYPVTPPTIIAVVCGMVARVLTAPSMIAGLGTERVGNYSYGLLHASPGPQARLTTDDKQELIDAGYRRTAGTIQLRT